MGSARDLYEEAIRRYNAADVAGFAACHTRDAVLVTPSGTVCGRSGIEQHWAAQRIAFPDLALTLDVVVAEGDTVAAEWTWKGTHAGPLVLRGGARIAPTGRGVEFQGMELARFRDGEIAEYRMYWDGVAVAQQLGGAPR